MFFGPVKKVNRIEVLKLDFLFKFLYNKRGYYGKWKITTSKTL